MRRQQRQKRIIVLLFLVQVAGLFLLGRLFWLQVIKGPELAKAVVLQRSLRHVYTTGRGQILDRHGRSLLDTRFETVLVAFTPVLDEETKLALVPVGTAPEKAVQVVRDLSPVAIRGLLAGGDAGMAALSQEVRYGPRALAPHVTGYVQRREQVSRRPRYRELSYSPQGGLEQFFHEEMAGRPQALAAVIDGRGLLIPGVGLRHWQEINPRRPYSVLTTLDSRLQATVERLGYRHLTSGAIVVLEPQNGDILALASFPAFDQASLHSGVSPEEFAKLTENRYAPFVNKAIAAYPPGSVFKVVLAAAALEQRLPEESFFCTGTLQVGDRSFSCYGSRPHGEVDMKKALAVSCNAYFIRLAQRLGRETVLDFASRFGFGRTANLLLPGESPGRLPTLAELPYLGDLANTSLGQGLVAATPLQLARLLAVVAGNGGDVSPRLVQAVTDRQGAIVRRYHSERGQRVISPSTARQLRSMLEQVVLTGTAREAYSLRLDTAGKSGTAQTGRADIPTYSWFAGLTAGDKPLVIVVFVEKRRDLTAAALFRLVAEETLAR
ncbi:MAG: hypothetical protein KGZ57_11635 [Dethiobacter sp.]|nr:hypothetical protein [Dethiobacter sp.]MCL5982339.1 penicillin-binding transpeptidase domain-containing protein [Bacillota bacterium]